LLVVGGGLGATQVLDIVARSRGLVPVGIVDDNPNLHGSEVMGVPVRGSIADAEKLWIDDAFDVAFISFASNIGFRARVYEDLRAFGIRFANVIDPTVTLSCGVTLGTGNYLGHGCRVGPDTTIGDNNCFTSYVNFEHHNEIGSHCTSGPGVMTSGLVRIGDRV